MTRDLFVIDDTKDYKEDMPPFTTLLGESYYPNSFWFNVGGILIRTSDNYEEVEQKIEKIWREYSQTTYAALDTIRYKIDFYHEEKPDRYSI